MICVVHSERNSRICVRWSKCEALLLSPFALCFFLHSRLLHSVGLGRSRARRFLVLACLCGSSQTDLQASVLSVAFLLDSIHVGFGSKMEPGDPLSPTVLARELMWDIERRFYKATSVPPMDTNSVYFASRYCSSCVRQWGDIDVILDIWAARYSLERVAIWGACLKRFPPNRGGMPDSSIRGPCCTRGVLGPQQHTIYDAWEKAARYNQTQIGEPPSRITLRARPPPRHGGKPASEASELMIGLPTVLTVLKILGI